MRITLEHTDVIKALALYVRTKGFVVEALDSNFVITNESPDPAKYELVITVKNADTAAPEPIPAPPAPQRPLLNQPQAPASRPTASGAPVRNVGAKPPLPAPKKNDLFRPVAPPKEVPPAPKHRVLDVQAAASPALALASRHGSMPAPSQFVHAFSGTEKGAEELVDDYAPPPVRRAAEQEDTSLIVRPEDMDPSELNIFNDLLQRSAALAEDGPHFAEDSASDPLRPEGYVEDE